MKLKFKDQQFQIDATAAVCDVFEGQPYHDPMVYTVDPGEVKRKSENGISAEDPSLPGLESVTQGRLDLEDDPPDVGYANAEIKISGLELLRNLHMVQDRNRLDRSQLSSGGTRGLTFCLNFLTAGTGRTTGTIGTIEVS